MSSDTLFPSQHDLVAPERYTLLLPRGLLHLLHASSYVARRIRLVSFPLRLGHRLEADLVGSPRALFTLARVAEGPSEYFCLFVRTTGANTGCEYFAKPGSEYFAKLAANTVVNAVVNTAVNVV